ncbi:MAG: hypothetical protein IJ480_06295 [Clostridia bacterium]|nr:hypothetical protein [Clostridia bacterium]
MRKITAAILLLAMLLSMAACGNTADTEETTADTAAQTEAAETEETRARHEVPEDLDFEGAPFQIAYPDWQGYKFYFFADEATGDAMNDAIFNRTINVEEYLNVDISQVNVGTIDQVVTEVKNVATAGDDAYGMALLHCISGVSDLVTGGYIYNLDTLPHINMEADWWNRAQMDVLRLGQNTYYGISDYMIPCPYAIFFNKEMIADNGMDNPYELVYEGKWTLDRFVDMAISVTQDLNGDGVYTMDDVVGVTANEISKYIPFMTAADQFITSTGDDGRIYMDMNNEKTISIVETVYKLMENPGTVSIPTGDKEEDMIQMDTGRLLFRLGAITAAEYYRDCEVDIGILPYPKYDEEQENYISQDWGGLMCVPVSISNPDMIGAVLEMLSWESANEVIPAYYDVTLSGKMARDEDSRNMLELLFDTIAYEIGGNYFGFSSGFSDLFYTMGRLVVTNKSTDFASWYAKNEKSANATLDKFYEGLEKVEG